MFKIGGSPVLTKFQQQISVFLKFVKDETVDEDLIQETINHYEYSFRKTNGRDFRKFTSIFHTTLSSEFSYTVFASTIKRIQLFRNIEHGFYHHFSSALNLSYYKKDTEIIRCNDVQRNLYFVHKGAVDITVARQTVTTLTKGGIFGNFHKKEIRQTISAFTKVRFQVVYLYRVISDRRFGITFFLGNGASPLFEDTNQNKNKMNQFHSSN